MQPAGRVDVVVGTEHSCPVVELHPLLEVQPSGNVDEVETVAVSGVVTAGTVSADAASLLSAAIVNGPAIPSAVRPFVV